MKTLHGVQTDGPALLELVILILRLYSNLCIVPGCLLALMQTSAAHHGFFIAVSHWDLIIFLYFVFDSFPLESTWTCPCLCFVFWWFPSRFLLTTFDFSVLPHWKLIIILFMFDRFLLWVPSRFLSSSYRNSLNPQTFWRCFFVNCLLKPSTLARNQPGKDTPHTVNDLYPQKVKHACWQRKTISFV